MNPDWLFGIGIGGMVAFLMVMLVGAFWDLFAMTWRDKDYKAFAVTCYFALCFVLIVIAFVLKGPRPQ